MTRGRSWKAFTARARTFRPYYDSDYEFLGRASWNSLEVQFPSKSPQALLFFTKSFLFRYWQEQWPLPEHLFILVRYGLPTVEQWKLIRDLAARVRLPICFVGDLDPLDLTVFVALRSGDSELRHPSRRALRISYCGIDDRWLTLAERHLSAEWKRHRSFPIIRMAPIELEHRDVILNLAPWLLDEIGPRSAELLRSGVKLELEGASNPAFYDKRFPRVLLKHLVKRAREAAR